MTTEKQLVGEKAAEFVEDGMIIGLGTGSTVRFTIEKIGGLVQQGLSIQGVATSIRTEQLAKECGIPLLSLEEVDELDLAIDGADEADPAFHLIKGGGGALLREKIIASSARRFVVVADPSKMVEQLGRFPLPVEVEAFGYKMTEKKIRSLGGASALRVKEGKPYITDNGHYIFDCDFGLIASPEELERELNLIPGVVENGLFIDMADMIITVNEKQEIQVKKRTKQE
ncbi:ribose-5-phosphate isomerase RpiA [Domibacillus indicus]|uniref:ribose-5-phosphate isomerase RpiA n=1 Tax=Domibacillus indicus TaxID=1437523 RepID=UPI00203F8BD8|nr:ribose-5-phosphate isomerase RpiA [Domibacillus indicus]MCM3790925.1 ribose-5-phosphate isomerase RpiA [Domibacillus indicus]